MTPPPPLFGPLGVRPFRAVPALPPRPWSGAGGGPGGARRLGRAPTCRARDLGRAPAAPEPQPAPPVQSFPAPVGAGSSPHPPRSRSGGGLQPPPPAPGGSRPPPRPTAPPPRRRKSRSRRRVSRATGRTCGPGMRGARVGSPVFPPTPRAPPSLVSSVRIAGWGGTGRAVPTPTPSGALEAPEPLVPGGRVRSDPLRKFTQSPPGVPPGPVPFGRARSPVSAPASSPRRLSQFP